MYEREKFSWGNKKKVYKLFELIIQTLTKDLKLFKISMGILAPLLIHGSILDFIKDSKRQIVKKLRLSYNCQLKCIYAMIDLMNYHQSHQSRQA